MTTSRLGRWLACAACALLAGCYTYTYTPVTPEPGKYVSLDINDMGRVGLTDRVGPGILRVEGDLAEATDSTYLVSVRKTVGIRGEMLKWSGESVRVSRQYVVVLRERHYSPTRTFVLAGSIAVAAGAFMASRGLLGFGGGQNTGDPPPPPVDQ